MIINKDLCYIESSVEISDKATIYPFVTLLGNTKIKENVVIYPYTVIKDSVINNGSVIKSSDIFCSEVGENSIIGPFARLRDNAFVKDNVRIGNFVEIKNSEIKSNTSVAHLSYLGDSFVGEKTNIGCGVITVNYDGKNKNKTFIGDNSFIGCNSNLIAPIKIGNKVIVAAGSTINSDIKDGDMVIARERETIKEGYGDKFYLKNHK